MSFAENFIYLRKTAKLTQEEIAEKLSISRQSVSKWETGEAFPEMGKLIVICDFFHVSVNDMLQSDLTVEERVQEEVEENAMDCVEENKGISRGRVIGSINGINFFLCVGFYFFCGAAFRAWHPTWIVFFLIPLVACLSTCWVSKGAFRGNICAAILLLSIIVYLLCGFYARLWHIMWVLFLLVPIASLLLEIFLSD